MKTLFRPLLTVILAIPFYLHGRGMAADPEGSAPPHSTGEMESLCASSDLLDTLRILRVEGVSPDEAEGAFRSAISIIDRYYVHPDVKISHLYIAALQGVLDFLNDLEEVRASEMWRPPPDLMANRLILPHEYPGIEEAITGEERGMGLTVTWVAGRGFLVTDVTEGSPAEKTGIARGDLIEEVDGLSIKSLPPLRLFTLLESLRQEEKEFEFTLLRPSGAGRKVKLKRGIIRKGVENRLMKGEKLLYIRFPSFYAGSYIDFKNAVEVHAGDNLEEVAIDLRGTGSGNLREMLKIAEFFIPRGEPILRILDRKEGEKVILSGNEDPLKKRVIILVDSGTRALGEALVSALIDIPHVHVAGWRTGGIEETGSIFPLPRGMAIRILTSRSLPPVRGGWGGTGIVPEIEGGGGEKGAPPSIMETLKLINQIE